MIRRAAILVLIAFLGVTLAFPQSRRFGKYRGPASLGAYSHARRAALRPFLARFGAQPSGKDVYCFADIKHGLYLYARIDDEHDRGQVNSVFVSTFPNCRHRAMVDANIDPAFWTTPERVGIGSTRMDVLHAYPFPTFHEKLSRGDARGGIVGMRDSEAATVDFGDWTYIYSCMIDEKNGCDDLRVAQFGFSHNRVIWISISDSE